MSLSARADRGLGRAAAGAGASLAAVAVLGACAPKAPAPLPDRPVTIALPAGPVTLVPDRTTEEFAFLVIDNLYESLVTLDAGLGLKPELAQGWYNEDDSTWVFRLRPGVRFHDGSPLTSAEVVAALERARSDPESTRRPELTPVASFEIIDDLTLRIRTREPYAALPRLLATVLVWKPGPTADAPPVGTGHYRLRSWTPESTELEAFADHRDGAPAVRSARFDVIPDAVERLARLRRGEVQLAYDVPDDGAPEPPDLRVLTEEGLRVVFLGMDCARDSNPHVSAKANPFRDVRVRTAVAQALDRDAIVSEALGGLGARLDQLAPSGSFGHDEGLAPLGHDPEAARRALAAAGFPDGFRVDLDYMPHKFRSTERVLARIVEDLGKMGIRAEPRPHRPTDFFKLVRDRDTALYLWGWLGSSGDAGISYGYLLHSRAGGFGVANAGGYSNPELDDLLARASSTLGLDEREGLLWRAAELIARDVPLIPLYRQTDVYAVDADLEFAPRADRRLPLTGLRWRSTS